MFEVDRNVFLRSSSFRPRLFPPPFLTILRSYLLRTIPFQGNLLRTEALGGHIGISDGHQRKLSTATAEAGGRARGSPHTRICIFVSPTELDPCGYFAALTRIQRIPVYVIKSLELSI